MEIFEAATGLEPSPVADRARSLVGGALLGSRVREAMPGVPITESHPKALLLALGLDDSGFAARFGIRAMWDDLHPRCGDRSGVRFGGEVNAVARGSSIRG